MRIDGGRLVEEILVFRRFRRRAMGIFSSSLLLEVVVAGRVRLSCAIVYYGGVWPITPRIEPDLYTS